MRLGETDVTVETKEEAVTLARGALADIGYPDADVDGNPERQVSVCVATASTDNAEFVVTSTR